MAEGRDIHNLGNYTETNTNAENVYYVQVFLSSPDEMLRIWEKVSCLADKINTNSNEREKSYSAVERNEQEGQLDSELSSFLNQSFLFVKDKLLKEKEKVWILPSPTENTSGLPIFDSLGAEIRHAFNKLLSSNYQNSFKDFKHESFFKNCIQETQAERLLKALPINVFLPILRVTHDKVFINLLVSQPSLNQERSQYVEVENIDIQPREWKALYKSLLSDQIDKENSLQTIRDLIVFFYMAVVIYTIDIYHIRLDVNYEPRFYEFFNSSRLDSINGKLQSLCLLRKLREDWLQDYQYSLLSIQRELSDKNKPQEALEEEQKHKTNKTVFSPKPMSYNRMVSFSSCGCNFLVISLLILISSILSYFIVYKISNFFQAQSSELYGIVNVPKPHTKANIRFSPSFESDRTFLAEVKNGKTLRLLRLSSDECWWEVKISSQTKGWIRSSFISVKNSTQYDKLKCNQQ